MSYYILKSSSLRRSAPMYTRPFEANSNGLEYERPPPSW